MYLLSISLLLHRLVIQRKPLGRAENRLIRLDVFPQVRVDDGLNPYHRRVTAVVQSPIL